MGNEGDTPVIVMTKRGHDPLPPGLWDRIPRHAAPAKAAATRLRTAHGSNRIPTARTRHLPMTFAAIYNTDFAALKDTDTVSEATCRMLADRVSDLPVVDGTGKLVGMLKLERLFAVLLPRAATMDYGMPDLSFVSDTVDQLRRRMHEIENTPVREYMVKPDHIVHPNTSPLEAVLLLYKGANAIPVVDPDSHQLVGMVAARDVLAALQDGGSK